MESVNLYLSKLPNEALHCVFDFCRIRQLSDKSIYPQRYFIHCLLNAGCMRSKGLPLRAEVWDDILNEGYQILNLILEFLHILLEIYDPFVLNCLLR